MRQVLMNQRTFGKQTKREIVRLVPSAYSYRKATKGGRLIKDRNGETVATWHPPQGFYGRRLGLLVIC